MSSQALVTIPSAAAERTAVLEQRASTAKTRLLRALDVLDQRRRRVAELSRRAKRFAVPTIAAFLGVALVAAGATVAIKVTVTRRRERKLSSRVARAIERLRPARPPSFVERSLSRVTLSVLVTLSTEVARRVAKNLLDGRTPDGRLVAGKVLEAHRHEA